MSSSLFSLQGKIAILTGATRGIGKGIAIGLAQAGADIILLQVLGHPHFANRGSGMNPRLRRKAK
jgi:NAD(P)-dependent dehydrogenase (short-subunit alcohol dehydrogenase family)